MTATPTNREDQPVLVMINQIKDRQLPPKSLSSEDRRRCVEVLRGEGYNLAEIGRILQCSERTIRRDLQALRAEHALSPDPHLAEQFVGNLVKEAEASVAHLRRLARESSASVMERLMAESSAWKVYREMIEKLQSLGYLPRMPAGVVADVFQHAASDPSAAYDQLTERLKQLARIDEVQGGDDPTPSTRRDWLMDQVERSRQQGTLAREVSTEVIDQAEGDRHEHD